MQSDRRTFISPALKQGASYTYTLKAEINRNGGPKIATKEVTVRAGGVTEVNFDFEESVTRR
jgi:uncharacterized protein (TIGR03000 family)